MDADQFQRFLNAARGGRKLSTFTSTDSQEWLNFRHEFEETVAINGWADGRARRELSAAVSGRAREAVQDILTGAAEAVPGPVAGLLDAYEARFVTPAATDAARAQFKDARQEEGEKVLAWGSRCRHLFIRAYPDVAAADRDANRELKEAFCVGLSNQVIMTQTLTAGLNTFNEMLERAMNLEATMNYLARRSVIPKLEYGKHSVNSIQEEESRVQAMGGPAGRRCYVCNSTQHLRDDCPLWAKVLQSASRRGRGGGYRGGGRGDRRGTQSRGRGRGGYGNNAKGGRRGGGGYGGRGSVNQMSREPEGEGTLTDLDFSQAFAGDPDLAQACTAAAEAARDSQGKSGNAV